MQFEGLAVRAGSPFYLATSRQLCLYTKQPPCLPPQVAYDVMDVDAPNSAADHGALRSAITGMEHRLGTLIMQVRWYPPMVTY